MGNNSSQAAATTPESAITDDELRNAPHNFYLVYGKPSIRFARDRYRGPLIYDVDIEYDEETDAVEHTATLDLSSAVPRRQPFELLLSPSPASESRAALSFCVVATDPPRRVRVLTGVSISYCPGEGLRLSDAEAHGSGAPRCVCTITDTAELREVTTPAVIELRELHPVRAETPSGDAAEGHSRPRVVYAPLVIEVDVGDTTRTTNASADTPRRQQRRSSSSSNGEAGAAATGQGGAEWRQKSPAPPPRRRLLHYTLLDVPTDPAAAVAQHNAATQSKSPLRLACTVAKQLLQVGCEVYELEDVFDVGRDEEAVNTAADSDDDNDLCVVCLTNTKNTTLLPCRHMCLCNECATQLRLTNNRCPMCRGNIERVMML